MNTVLYIGVTNNLIRRLSEHKAKFYRTSFTSKYSLNKLLYFESCSDIRDAITREKSLKNWKRSWKLELIKQENPLFRDLAEDWE